jgi:hypothetical protein
MENKRTIQTTNETKSWFSERINKIDKPLAELPKQRGRGPKLTKIWDDKGDTTTNTNETQRLQKLIF